MRGQIAYIYKRKTRTQLNLSTFAFLFMANQCCLTCRSVAVEGRWYQARERRRTADT